MTDTDSGNGLLLDDTKPLAESLLKIIPDMINVIRGGVSSIS